MHEGAERLRELVTEVAAAYFAKSHVPPSDISTVIGQIAVGLIAVGDSDPAAPPAPVDAPAKPTAAQIRASVMPDALISFEDGKPYKTLGRHLTARGLTPQAYRAKWGLPPDYPLVASSYSAARSSLAKSLGLGRKPGALKGRSKG